MSITKLEDNVGTGQSLLGSVLHSRVDAQGIVPKTVTRVFIAASLASGSVPSQEICDFHAVFLGETDTDVTGLFLLVQRDSCIHALEASPETITALLRHMLGTPMFSGITIVSAVEDCPSRCFASWSYRSVALPQEPMLGEAATVLAATGVAHAVCRGLTQCGVAMKQVVSESGNMQAALDEIQRSLLSYVPSREKITWLAQCSKLVSAQQYLDLFSIPITFRL